MSFQKPVLSDAEKDFLVPIEELEAMAEFIKCNNLSSTQIANKYPKGLIAKLCIYLGIPGSPSTPEIIASRRLSGFFRKRNQYKKADPS